MRIIVTAEELIDKGLWENFCEEKGINPYAVKEGLMDQSEEFSLSEDDAKKFGLISKD